MTHVRNNRRIHGNIEQDVYNNNMGELGKSGYHQRTEELLTLQMEVLLDIRDLLQSAAESPLQWSKDGAVIVKLAPELRPAPELKREDE